MYYNIDDFIDVMMRSLDVAYLNRTRTGLTIRCFECGDSKKNPYHAHLNIRLSDPEHLVWRCPRCEASGAVNSDFMRSLGIYDSDALSFAHGNSMRIKKLRYNVTGKETGKLREIVNPIVKSDEAYEKVDYCNNRLGLDLDLETWVRDYKLVSDFRKLFSVNKWMQMTEDKDKMAELADEGVGFISSDNSAIIFRDMYNNWHKRYCIYNVYKTHLPDFSTSYAPTCIINSLEEKVDVNLTEGIFDIIGVREHIKQTSHRPQIYLSCNGKSYINSVNIIAKKGFLDQHIRIYSDNDVPLYKFQNMKQYNPVMKISSMEVFYNTLSKDFGVPLSKIKIKRTML